MNLEQLTKHQIVLLTLLVSFVTSIATGIVTVSLMGQAPPGVTKTINQIVEHTVEKVVPSTQGAAPITTTEKTVVVKDDDLAAQSIASVQKSVIRITTKGSDQLVARGIIIDTKGTALTDAAALGASGADAFDAIMSDGKRVPIIVEKQTSTTSPIAIIAVAVGTSTLAGQAGFVPATITDSSKLQLGQSTIRIGGKGVDSVSVGVIAMLPTKASNEIEANVTSTTPGSIIITLFGEVIGIATTQSLAEGSDFYTIATNPLAAAATSTSTQ